KKTQGNRTDLTSAPNGAKVRNSKVLADKAGVGHGSITRLITVYRNRLDLTSVPIGTKVRDGKISINKAYTTMKDDEKPEEVAAIVILLYYHDLKAEARANSLANLKQNPETPEVESRTISGEVA